MASPMFPSCASICVLYTNTKYQLIVQLNSMKIPRPRCHLYHTMHIDAMKHPHTPTIQYRVATPFFSSHFRSHMFSLSHVGSRRWRVDVRSGVVRSGGGTYNGVRSGVVGAAAIWLPAVVTVVSFVTFAGGSSSLSLLDESTGVQVVWCFTAGNNSSRGTSYGVVMNLPD